MDWANERWVKLYTRDTADDLVLSWQAFALWPLLLRKADRAGVIATNHGARGIAALLRWPSDVATAALDELLEDGRVGECVEPRGFVIRNYRSAQDSCTSDGQRQRDKRERDASIATRSKAANNSVTKRDKKSRDVTPAHDESRDVTPRVEESRQEEIRVDESRYGTAANAASATFALESPSVEKPKKRGSEFQPAIDAFHRYFTDQTGSRPTWTEKQIGQIHTLCRKHGLEEVIRRLNRLATSPPSFPPTPWDASAFVQHFDKLAIVAARPMSPTEIAMQELAELEAAESDDGREFPEAP